MADKKKKGDAPKKVQRSGSNVFAMFSQQQVQVFKEAFQMIDQDKDGFISKNDIRQTFDSLGRLCTEQELDSMIAEAPGPINFTMFLTIFGDRAQGKHSSRSSGYSLPTCSCSINSSNERCNHLQLHLHNQPLPRV